MKIIERHSLNLPKEKLGYEIAKVVDKKFDELRSSMIRFKSRAEILERELKKFKNN